MSDGQQLATASASVPILGGAHFPSGALHSSIEVSTGKDPGSKDQKLDQAVNMLVPAALERRHGILVIERGDGKYTVRVDQEVPCGVTRYQIPSG